eukprot:30956-Pelagococcus_subviridis.AAC.4
MRTAPFATHVECGDRSRWRCVLARLASDRRSASDDDDAEFASSSPSRVVCISTGDAPARRSCRTIASLPIVAASCSSVIRGALHRSVRAERSGVANGASRSSDESRTTPKRAAYFLRQASIRSSSSSRVMPRRASSASPDATRRSARRRARARRFSRGMGEGGEGAGRARGGARPRE